MKPTVLPLPEYVNWDEGVKHDTVILVQCWSDPQELIAVRHTW